VFNLDEGIRGLPATKEQVASLHQSINAPHVAIPGKQAGTAQAFIVGLRRPQGFAVYIYLYLAETQESAVYASDKKALKPEEFASAEQEAIGFVESMGFFMDTMNFRSLPLDQQDELIRSLPVFQKAPVVQAAAEKKDSKSASAALGRFFASF
jgi:hypothetical protein